MQPHYIFLAAIWIIIIRFRAQNAWDTSYIYRKLCLIKISSFQLFRLDSVGITNTEIIESGHCVF
jgi:hypothetical protein